MATNNETAVETLHVLQSLQVSVDRIGEQLAKLAGPALRRQRASKHDWRERAAIELHRMLRETGKVPTADALVRYVDAETGVCPDLSDMSKLINARLDRLIS